MKVQVNGVIVMGRQHSGNTFLTRIIGTSPNSWVDENENDWFERVGLIEQSDSLQDRVHLSIQYMLRNEAAAAKVQEIALYNWAKQQSKVTAYDLFRKGMELVTLAKEKQLWALKATSYIFYARTILEYCPEIKLIYLMRNPLDLTASTKKRNPKGLDWLIATNIAWKKGVAIAQQLATKYPERFLIVQYENIIRQPETLREVAHFLQIELGEAVQQLPVVNTSDRPYQVSQQTGLLNNKIYYFHKVLSHGEIAWATALSGGVDALQSYYPDLPNLNKIGILYRIRALPTVFKMGVLFARKHLNLLDVNNLNRVRHRIKLMIRSS
ncbi:MAG: sulfotransferase [Bacteroidota bacterium]